MLSVCSDWRQMELRRLSNQLPVLGKTNSLCKIVKCVFCLSGLRRARDKDSSFKIRVASRRCSTIVPVAPPGSGKILTPAFYAFLSVLSRFFVR